MSYKCELHSEKFQFFCERCYQPICRQCTIIGPHNTQNHLISKISIAYERRVQQIRSRISYISQNNRQKIREIIKNLNQKIQLLHSYSCAVDGQNLKQKQKLISKVQKEFQNIRSYLDNLRQQLQQKSNQINDIGYHYQNMTSDIQLCASHDQIIFSLKQIFDRTLILIQKNVQLPQFTKDLTKIRLDLTEIQCLKQLYQQKVIILNKIFKKINTIKNNKETPLIPYEQLLSQLNQKIATIKHYVCYFCGAVFTFQSVNEECFQNNVQLNVGLSTQFAGFTTSSPDSTKFSTRRHYFGQPKLNAQFYKNSKNSSFEVQINCLYLKAKTLCKLKKVNLKKQIQKNDPKGIKHCQKIVIDYILIQMLGMTPKQSEILLLMCDKNQQQLRNYEYILDQISKIQI